MLVLIRSIIIYIRSYFNFTIQYYITHGSFICLHWQEKILHQLIYAKYLRNHLYMRLFCGEFKYLFAANLLFTQLTVFQVDYSYWAYAALLSEFKMISDWHGAWLASYKDSLSERVGTLFNAIGLCCCRICSICCCSTVCRRWYYQFWLAVFILSLMEAYVLWAG